MDVHRIDSLNDSRNFINSRSFGKQSYRDGCEENQPTNTEAVMKSQDQLNQTRRRLVLTLVALAVLNELVRALDCNLAAGIPRLIPGVGHPAATPGL
jgi:hypothetical protein